MSGNLHYSKFSKIIKYSSDSWEDILNKYLQSTNNKNTPTPLSFLKWLKKNYDVPSKK